MAIRGAGVSSTRGCIEGWSGARWHLSHDDIIQKKIFFLYWFYYLNTLRDSLSSVCGIFFCWWWLSCHFLSVLTVCKCFVQTQLSWKSRNVFTIRNCLCGLACHCHNGHGLSCIRAGCVANLKCRKSAGRGSVNISVL